MTRKNRLLTNRAISLLLCLLMLLLCIPVSAVAEGSLGRVEETTTAEPDVPPFTTPQEDPPLTPTTPSLGTATIQPPIGDFRVPEKPSFIDETATRAVPLVTDLPDGNYHMRNLRTGWLLREKATISTYGCPVEMGFHTTNLADEWIFEWQPGDSYVIRSAAHPNSVLVDGGDAPAFTPIPDDYYGDMHIWYLYDYGGYYYIKSYLNDQYLCHDGEDFFMSNTVPQGSSTNYLWDLIDTDDYTPLTGFTINNSYWLAENTAEYVDLTITPSYADWAEYDEIGYNDFVWTSSNQNVAFVSGGIIFVYDAGYAILTAQHRATGLTKSFTVTVGQVVPDGTYYIKNVKSEKFIDIEGPSSAAGARIQQWAYNASTQSRWNVDYLGNGIYTIQSVYSNKYVGIESSSALDVYIEQYTSVSDLTKWEILYSASGNFIFVPYLWMNNYRALTVPVGYEYNGTDLRHAYYTEDNDYNDEWLVYKMNYSAVVYNYYDMGYPVRFGETEANSQLIIDDYMRSVALRFLELCELSIRFYPAEYYNSALDECKGVVNADNIDNICSHEGVVHSDRSEVIEDFRQAYLGNQTTTYALWSGHKILSVSSDGQININRSCSVGAFIFMLRTNILNRAIRSQGTLMHELVHQYGGRDHYHETIIVDGEEVCKFKDICTKCGENKRPGSCIMANSNQSIQSDSILCSGCILDILTHLEDHH